MRMRGNLFFSSGTPYRVHRIRYTVSDGKVLSFAEHLPQITCQGIPASVFARVFALMDRGLSLCPQSMGCRLDGHDPLYHWYAVFKHNVSHSNSSHGTDMQLVARP